MPLSWNEIKTRAVTFNKEWEHETSEDAEAKSFWDGFFNIFDIRRRRVATVEQVVQKLDNKTIDLCYRPQPFQNETKRIEFLFELYNRYTAGMFAGEKARSKGPGRRNTGL